MSIDITEQAKAVREHIAWREGFPKSLISDFDRPHYEAETAVWRAILATLERVAAEERPERMQ